MKFPYIYTAMNGVSSPHRHKARYHRHQLSLHHHHHQSRFMAFSLTLLELDRLGAINLGAHFNFGTVVVNSVALCVSNEKSTQPPKRCHLLLLLPLL